MRIFPNCTPTLLLAILVTVVLSGCGDNSPPKKSFAKYPDSFGIYAVEGDEFKEIKPAVAGIVTMELSPDVSFLIYDKSVTDVYQGFSLVKKRYIRMQVATTPDGQVTGRVRLNTWENAPDKIEGKVTPVKGQPDMVVWEPRSPLLVGLYLVEIQSQLGPRFMDSFYIDKQNLLHNIDGGLNCFDKLTPQYFGLPVGEPTYAHCHENR